MRENKLYMICISLAVPTDMEEMPYTPAPSGYSITSRKTEVRFVPKNALEKPIHTLIGTYLFGFDSQQLLQAAKPLYNKLHTCIRTEAKRHRLNLEKLEKQWGQLLNDWDERGESDTTGAQSEAQVFDLYIAGAMSPVTARSGIAGYCSILLSRDTGAHEKFQGSGSVNSKGRILAKALREGLGAPTLRADHSASRQITIHTSDSDIVPALNRKQLETWAGNGWKKSNGKPVANQDLWVDIWSVLSGLQFQVEQALDDDVYGTQCAQSAQQLANEESGKCRKGA